MHRARVRDNGSAWKARVLREEASRIDLGSEQELRDFVCAGFCTFWRAGKAEAGCGGLAVLRKLAAAGLLPVEDVLAASEGAVSYESDRFLENAACATCPYLPEGGCDYRDVGVETADKLEPCGGYIVLAVMLERGLVTTEEVLAASLGMGRENE